VKLFLVGAPCAGKTTLMPPLRATLPYPVLDMDEEILRLNRGTWPSIEAKRGLARRVIDEASRHDDVVLAYSQLDREQLGLLNGHGWVICLLNVPEAVLRERAEQRLEREGWTNIEWLPLHLRTIEELLTQDAFAHVLDATSPVPVVVDALLEILDNSKTHDTPVSH
jgi:shikimate kinase